MILIIDDNVHDVSALREELELSGIEVCLQTSVDSALTFFRENQTLVELVVLDIVMPPGKSAPSDEPLNGLTTGLFVFKQLRQVKGDVPIIVLTNSSSLENVFLKQPRCKFLRKTEYFSFEVVQEIAKFKQSVEP